MGHGATVPTYLLRNSIWFFFLCAQILSFCWTAKSRTHGARRDSADIPSQELNLVFFPVCTDTLILLDYSKSCSSWAIRCSIFIPAVASFTIPQYSSNKSKRRTNDLPTIPSSRCRRMVTDGFCLLIVLDHRDTIFVGNLLSRYHHSPNSAKNLSCHLIATSRKLCQPFSDLARHQRLM